MAGCFHLQQARGEDDVQTNPLAARDVQGVIMQNDERQDDGVDVADDAEHADDGVERLRVRARVRVVLHNPLVVEAHPVGAQRAADQEVAERVADQVGGVESQGEVDGQFPAAGERAGHEAAVEEEDGGFGRAGAEEHEDLQDPGELEVALVSCGSLQGWHCMFIFLAVLPELRRRKA